MIKNYVLKPKLSICIIVGKEEANLKRCLDSFLPIIHEPWCELIVVCTQPGDRTEEVAREYTDNVFFQEWKNDFSFHRNFANSKATGERTLTVDADDALPQEMIYKLEDIVLNPKYSEIETFFFVIRSYHDAARKTYSEILQPRLFTRIDGELYSGAVHNKPICNEPFHFANDFYLWHYGYIWEGTTLLQEKTARSLPLLQTAYEADPLDLHTLTHLVKTYFTVQKYDDVIKYGERWVVLMNEVKEKGDFHKGWYSFLEVFVHLVASYLGRDDIDSALKTVTEAEKFTGRLMPLYFALGSWYLKKDQTAEAIAQFERGLDIARGDADPYEAMLSDFSKMMIPEVLYTLSVEYFILGDDRRAGDYLNQAIRNNDNRLNLRWDIWNEERAAKRLKKRGKKAE